VSHLRHLLRPGPRAGAPHPRAVPPRPYTAPAPCDGVRGLLEFLSLLWLEREKPHG